MGDYIFRSHVFPRSKLFVSNDDVPIHLNYIDGQRQTKTSIDVLHVATQTIDDDWNIDGDKRLSEPWIGMTKIRIAQQNPTRKTHVGSRQTDITRSCNKTWTKAVHKWAEDETKLTLREQNEAFTLLRTMSLDHVEIIDYACRKLEKSRAPAKPCTVTTPGNPSDSSCEPPCASDWSKMEAKRLIFSCSKQDHGNIIIASHRTRTTKSEEKTHQDHIVDRGQVSMSHYNTTWCTSQFPDNKEWKSHQQILQWTRDWRE